MELKERPKIKVERSFIQNLLDTIAIISLGLIIIYLLLQWSNLPAHVPTHYNLSGEPNAWGSKGMIWVPLIIGIVMWIGLAILERFPHTYNYMNLTKDNVEKQYKNAQLLINFLKNEIGIYFAYSAWNDVQIANGIVTPLSSWSGLIFIIILFSTLIFFIIRSIKIK